MEFDAKDDRLIRQWYSIRDISTDTQENYNISIRDYCELIGKNPSELIDEAETEEDDGIRIRKRKVVDYLLQYKDYLENKVAPTTVQLYFSAIRSFYKSFDIILPEIKLSTGDIGLEKNIGKPLTRGVILKLISAASSREKAIIYLMVLSGMGQQEARNLTINKLISAASQATGINLETIEDLFKHEEHVLEEILTLEITRKKVKYRHHTFIPPEASREIIAYLKERCYGRNSKIRITENFEEPIFVNNYGKKLSRDSIVTNFRRIGQDAGLKKEKGSYAYWRSHALRKYFISTIINKIGEKTIADYMAGHKISNQDRTYWIANPEDLKQHYLKALPYLSIDEVKVKDYETKEYREIKEKNEALQAQVDEININMDSIKVFTDSLHEKFPESNENSPKNDEYTFKIPNSNKDKPSKK